MVWLQNQTVHESHTGYPPAERHNDHRDAGRKNYCRLDFEYTIHHVLQANALLSFVSLGFVQHAVLQAQKKIHDNKLGLVKYLLMNASGHAEEDDNVKVKSNNQQCV